MNAWRIPRKKDVSRLRNLVYIMMYLNCGTRYHILPPWMDMAHIEINWKYVCEYTRGVIKPYPYSWDVRWTRLRRVRPLWGGIEPLTSSPGSLRFSCLRSEWRIPRKKDGSRLRNLVFIHDIYLTVNCGTRYHAANRDSTKQPGTELSCNCKSVNRTTNCLLSSTRNSKTKTRKTCYAVFTLNNVDLQSGALALALQDRPSVWHFLVNKYVE